MSSTRTSQRPAKAAPRTKRVAREERAPSLERIPEVAAYLGFVNRITVDYVKVRREVERLHRQRKSRKMTADRGRIRNSDLLEVSAQEAALRSRVTEILMEAKRLTTRIDKMRNAAITILIEGGANLPGSSKTAKQNLLAVRLDQLTPVLDDLYDVVDACDYVLEDMKQTGFSVARIKDLYELNTRPDLT